MRFLIRLIVIALVAVVIAVVGLLMLPGEKIARIAADQISKQTGREVSISSDTSISFYPILGITTGEATVGTADWAKNGPLFHTDSLAIGVDVPALLTGTIRITKLEATAPRVVLERAADGRANWEFFPTDPAAPPQSSSAADQSAETDEGQSYDLSLERALITGAALRYIDHAAGTDQSFENVDLDLSWPDMGGPAVATLAIAPFSERLVLKATVGDVMGLAGGAQTPLSGTLDAVGAKIEFKGAASIAPTLAMQIDGDIPDAGALLRALGQDPASFGLAPSFAPRMTLSSQTSFDGSRLALRQMSASVEDSTVKGDVDVVLTDALPGVTAKLALDVKSAGKLMRMFGQAPETFGFSPEFDPSAKTDLSFSFAGGDLSASLRNLSASVEDATVAGTADITLRAGVPDISADLALNLPNAARTAALFGQPLSTFGLSGEAAPSVNTKLSGSLKGSDITATLRDLSAQIENASIAGAADINLIAGVPDVSTTLALNLPNAGRTAALLGQPLSNFGLPAGAAPSVKSDVVATVQGDTINANLSNLVASLAGAQASGGLQIAIAGGAPSLSGRVKATVPSTANLMSALGQAAPDLPKGFGRAIVANTAISFNANTLKLSDMNLSLDQNAFSGAVTLALGGSVPSINATLAAGALDFSALTAEDGTPAPKSAGQGWSKDRIDASALGLINGSIALRASSINLGTIQLGATDLGVTIDNSRAVVAINDLRAYQGSFGGQVVANNRNGLSVGGDLRANSIALKPLLSALAGVDKIAGSANLNLSFLGSGPSLDAIMRSLSGQVGLSVPQGTIAGIDLENLIRQGNANASLTQFSNLAANGAIQAGVLYNEDLRAVTGRVDVKGEGQINLGAQTLDYLVTPIAKDVGSQDRIEIPVRIKGPWSAPTIRPDLAAALNLEAERKKLEERARQEIEREKEKLRQQAEAEKERLRQQAEAKARELEAQARKKLEDAARKAAQQAAERLRLDQAQQRQLEDAAKRALENELGKGLRGLLGRN